MVLLEQEIVQLFEMGVAAVDGRYGGAGDARPLNLQRVDLVVARWDVLGDALGMGDANFTRFQHLS